MMLDHVFKITRTRLETAIWAAELLLLCVGIVSTVVFFKAAIIPCLLNLTLSTLPQLWTSFKSCCLSPLYIYIIVNFIIITIAASSTFQRQSHKHNLSSSSSVASSYISNNAAKSTRNIDPTDNFIYSPDNRDSKYNSSSNQALSHHHHTIQNSHSIDDAKALFSSSSSHDNHQCSSHEIISWHDIHTVQSHNKQEEKEEEESINDDHQKFDHPSPETFSGDSCLTDSVETPTSEVKVGDMDTLDTTWKAIMEGQGKPIGKHLKKSDTWDTAPRLTGQMALKSSQFKVREHQLGECNMDEDDDEDDAVTWARRELKKSDTFSDRVSLRREKSMCQEELNQRAEAFIKKINNDIRLQRLESDQRRFREIVNGGF